MSQHYSHNYFYYQYNYYHCYHHYQNKQYDHTYRYEGDKTLEPAFNLERNLYEEVKGLKSFYKEGTLVSLKGEIGTISNINTDHKQATSNRCILEGELMRRVTTEMGQRCEPSAN